MELLNETRIAWLCGLCLLIVSQIESHVIVKRNAIQMCDLVTMYTGRSCFNYNPYGCFCGYGQQGSTPTDDADRCCKQHDDCYGDVQEINNCDWPGMFIGYRYRCRNKVCNCLEEENRSACARKTCECDLRLAECLGNAEYNPRYKYHNRQLCL